MATETRPKPKKFRYALDKFLKGIPELSILDTCDVEYYWYEFFKQVKTLPIAGEIRLDVSNYNRPDLLSHTAYRDTRFFWIIIHYNGILDPTDFTYGRDDPMTVVYYPSISDLEDLYIDILEDQPKVL